MIQKQKRFKSQRYLDWIKEQPSAYSGDVGYDGNQIVPAHQAITKMFGGTGSKVPDCWVLPLTHYEHTAEHNVGPQMFWGRQYELRAEMVCNHIARFLSEGNKF